MPLEFQRNQFAGLSTDDQVQKCRAMAVEARNLAASADRDMRNGYLDLACRWDALADEMDGSQGARRLKF